MKAEDIQKALKKKGFREKEGKRHTKYILYANGKKTRIMVVFSRGKNKKELGNDLIKRIQDELHLNDNDKFQDFIECPLTYEDYLEILREQGLIER